MNETLTIINEPVLLSGGDFGGFAADGANWTEGAARPITIEQDNEPKTLWYRRSGSQAVFVGHTEPEPEPAG